MAFSGQMFGIDAVSIACLSDCCRIRRFCPHRAFDTDARIFFRFPSNPACSPCQRDCSAHMKLKGILDTVLSTAVGLRQLTAQQSYDDACPTIPLWYSLMKAIGMASFESAHILEVPFILPWMSPCEASEQHKHDGIATTLVCLSFDKDKPLSSTLPTGLDDAFVRKLGSDIELDCAKVCDPISDIEVAYVSARKPRSDISMEHSGSDELDAASQQVESHSEEDQVKSSAHDLDADVSVDGKFSADESDDNVSVDDESSTDDLQDDICV